MLPETPWNLPRTLLTMRWRAENSTAVWTGSSCQSPGSGISTPWMLRVSVWLISALLVWEGKSFEAATVA